MRFIRALSRGFVHTRRQDCLPQRLEEKFEPAVVVPRQRRHDAFLANFPPILFIKQVANTHEHSRPPLPKPEFSRQIPDVVSWDEAFERIAVIAEFIVHDRSQHGEFESILVAINSAGLYLIIRCVCRRIAVVRPRGKLRVEQRDIAVESEITVGARCTAVDERENVELGGGFKSDITGVANVFGRSKTVRENNLADLVGKREVETAYVEIEVRERFPANSIFELKSIPLLQVAVDDTARTGWHQLPVSDWAISLGHCSIKFNTRRANACDDRPRRILGLGALFSGH